MLWLLYVRSLLDAYVMFVILQAKDSDENIGLLHVIALNYVVSF